MNIWKLTKEQRKQQRELALAMLSGGFSFDEICEKLGGDVTKQKIKMWQIWRLNVKEGVLDIKYEAKGYCVTKHKKHRKIAVCVIGGENYCFICGCERLAKRGISRKQLKKARNIKFKGRISRTRIGCRKSTKKQQGDKNTKATWRDRVFAGWKDTPEQAAFRRSAAYQEWRKIVLERDSYTCQYCQETGGRLVVHHIKTFKMNPELRLEPKNGIVLCSKCHEELHLSRVSRPKILKMA